MATVTINNFEKPNSALDSDMYTRILDGFVIFFAVWTFYCNLLVYIGTSFNILVYLSFVVVAIIIGLLYLLSRLKLKGSPSPSIKKKSSGLVHVPWQFLLLGSGIIVMIYTLTDNYLLFWVLATSLLTLNFLNNQAGSEYKSQLEDTRVKWQNWIIPAIALTAAAITLVAHRPDIDDAGYLGTIVSILDFPSRPMLHYDGLLGEAELPILAKFYKVNSYELFVTLLPDSIFTGTVLLYYPSRSFCILCDNCPLAGITSICRKNRTVWDFSSLPGFISVG